MVFACAHRTISLRRSSAISVLPRIVSDGSAIVPFRGLGAGGVPDADVARTAGVIRTRAIRENCSDAWNAASATLVSSSGFGAKSGDSASGPIQRESCAFCEPNTSVSSPTTMTRPALIPCTAAFIRGSMQAFRPTFLRMIQARRPEAASPSAYSSAIFSFVVRIAPHASPSVVTG